MSKRLRSDSNIAPGKMPTAAGAQLKLSNLSTAELCDRLANVWVHDLPTTDDIAVIDEAARRLRALTELTSSTLKGRPNLGDLRSLAEGETITVAWLQYVEALEKQVRALPEWRPAGEVPKAGGYYIVAHKLNDSTLVDEAYFNIEWQRFTLSRDGFTIHQPVAWCEIPEYTEGR